jgi:hypothetical protein
MASGSSKRDHPGGNNSGPSKRHDHHTNTYSDIAFPVSDNDDANESDAEAMDDGPYSEAQEAFPQHPAFDKALVALDTKFVRLTKELQKTIAVHSFVSKDLQNIKSRVSHAILPLEPERITVAMVGATAAGKMPDIVLNTMN